MSNLHTKYRPTCLEEFIGNDSLVNSLAENIFSDDPSHAYLFSGKQGVGKTSLSRIVAKELGCEPMNMVQIDGAKWSGVDSIRELIESVKNPPLLCGGGIVVVIIDEVHALTKQSFTTLLHPLEEPPEHLYWIFCTTEPEKIPKNIQSRLYHYPLRRLSMSETRHVVDSVVLKEGMETNEDIRDLCAEVADGLPREALVSLGLVGHCETRKEAFELLQEAKQEVPFNEFCQFLLTAEGLEDWIEAMSMYNSLKLEPFAARNSLLGYFGVVAKKGTKQSFKALSFLDALQAPIVDPMHESSVLLALAKVVLPDE